MFVTGKKQYGKETNRKVGVLIWHYGEKVEKHHIMPTPDQKLHFNGTWRSYQQRILDHLDVHVRDRKLHVVAAPGAGNGGKP